MVFLGGVSCDDEYAICEKEGITEYPTVRIYPKSPIPTSDFTSNDYDIEQIKKTALRTIEGKTIEISQTNIETFLKDNPTKPKVLFYSDKPKGIPVTIKALSSAFEKTIFFGVVWKEEESIISKYKVKKFPTLQIFKTGQKPVDFVGNFKYQELHDFLNVYSEIFVFKGDDNKENAAARPWLSEPLPEL